MSEAGPALYPLKFRPLFKQRIWGGRRLAELFDKPLPPGELIGESWELSGLPGDESVVANGSLAGRKLTELVEQFGDELLGGAGLLGGQFPLLIKLLDARQPLSVQVHPRGNAECRMPNVESSARLKTECWYVLNAAKDAKIWLGLEGAVSRERFAAAVATGRVEPLLHVEPARAGSFFFLPAGTLHALGGGLVVAEVQTPSDTTYRVFDWNRADAATGKPRALHVAEALDAIDFAAALPAPPKRRHAAGLWSLATELVRCDYFAVERVQMSEGLRRELPAGQLAAWLILAGRGEFLSEASVEAVQFKAGELVLLPAAWRGRVEFADDCTWLETTVPDRRESTGQGTIGGRSACKRRQEGRKQRS